MLWIVLAVMTAAALFAVLWPLGRVPAEPATPSDVAIYRDQLEEIERDRASGLLDTVEANAARIEVSRRLLAAADAARPAPVAPATRLRHRRMVAVAALVLFPLAAGFIYLALGSPGLQGQPLALRRTAPAEANSITSLITRVEAHLERNPQDGHGWEVVAPVYLRLGRYDDAVRASRNALNILGETAERQANLGEALAEAAGGVVTTEAMAAFARAAVLDGNNPRAQFYVGLAAEQDGRRAEAIQIWRQLMARAPADAAWAGYVREALARVEVATDSAAGPSVQDMAGASRIAPADRERMIRGMVERLAARMAADGSDVDGWLRLMRAYMVLGERDKARAAAADARRALTGEPEKLRLLNEGSKNFGLDG